MQIQTGRVYMCIHLGTQTQQQLFPIWVSRGCELDIQFCYLEITRTGMLCLTYCKLEISVHWSLWTLDHTTDNVTLSANHTTLSNKVKLVSKNKPKDNSQSLILHAATVNVVRCNVKGAMHIVLSPTWFSVNLNLYRSLARSQRSTCYYRPHKVWVLLLWHSAVSFTWSFPQCPPKPAHLAWTRSTCVVWSFTKQRLSVVQEWTDTWPTAATTTTNVNQVHVNL